uniref:Angiopoietin-like 1b n=1 Tax=Petromyzon marinus TaxID=7757 RepID=S4RS51_PETMA
TRDTMGLCLLLLLAAATTGAQRKEAEMFPGSEDDMEFIHVPRYTRSTDTQGKCSYTFIVPQQKVTGPICLNSQGAAKEEVAGSGVTKRDVEEIRDDLLKHKRQIEGLQHMVEVDGGIVNEVKLLRKESRNMNSRVTQLYLQLLHEIIRKRDNSLEISQLENKILNQTADMLKLASKYKDLEQKYHTLKAAVNNQSTIIAWLEEQCRKTYNPQPPRLHDRNTLNIPPQQAPNSHRYSLNQLFINEIQRDQTLLQTVPPKALMNTIWPNASMKKPGPWRDCQHAWDEGHQTSGIYLIRPEGTSRLMQAWCEQFHDPGGWLIVQRRKDGSVNFFRNWENYKLGFGNIDSEYWLGLENLYWLTNQTNYKLLVLMEDWQGRKVFAEYASFRVENESDHYRLRLGRFNGNAGDSLIWHNNRQFTTLDRDRDSYSGNCAHFQKGGWWYNACAHSNLNGVWYRGGHYRSKYQDGVYWAEFRGGSYSLKKVLMMIRPNP